MTPLPLLLLAASPTPAATPAPAAAPAPIQRPQTVAPLPGGLDAVLVVNDNNLPFSAGRFLRRADDTEFVLLRLPPGP